MGSKVGPLELDFLGGEHVAHDVVWYNPRSGGGLVSGSVRSISGTGKKPLGDPPAEPGKDWVVLIKVK